MRCSEEMKIKQYNIYDIRVGDILKFDNNKEDETFCSLKNYKELINKEFIVMSIEPYDDGYFGIAYNLNYKDLKLVFRQAKDTYQIIYQLYSEDISPDYYISINQNIEIVRGDFK